VKLGILGAGAVGCAYGHLLHRGGQDGGGRHRGFRAAELIRPDREPPGDGQQAQHFVDFVIGQRPVARRDRTEHLGV